MLDEKEMREAIKKLKHDVKINEINKSSLILTIILIAMSFIAGGVLLGAILGEMMLSIIIGISASIPMLAARVKVLSDTNTDIRLSKDQIIKYESDIKELETKRVNLEKPIPKKEETKRTTKNYSYVKNKDNTPKKREPKIEFFDERDFDDEPLRNSNKSR